MSVILAPYHLDEYLPDLDLPLMGDVVTADLGDGDTWGRLAALYSAVADTVADAVGRGACPVVVSGDCTTALGTVAGLQRAGTDAGIVWFDAHGDVQTLETTASGYLGGLPLRLLAGYRPELIARRLGLRVVPEEQIVLVGARDLDPPEISYLESAKIGRFEVADLAGADLMGTNLAESDSPDGPLYLHLDLDVIDPSEVPGLRYPTPGGPGVAQVASALRRLLGTGRVAAVGIACTVHPGHDAVGRITQILDLVPLR